MWPFMSNSSAADPHKQEGCSRMANIVVAILGFTATMAGHCAASTTESQQPVIYVTLARWENRTFSPRLYYVTMVQQQTDPDLKGPPEQTYAYETPPLVAVRYEDNQLSPVVSNRDGFTKDQLSLSVPLQSDSDKQENVAKSSAETGITFRIEKNKRNRTTVSHRGEITILDSFAFGKDEDKGAKFDLIADEGEPIVFKDAGLGNRRKHPENKNGRIRDDPNQQISTCSWNGRNPTGVKMPRSTSVTEYSENIDTLKLSLQIAQSNELIGQNFVFSPLSIFNVLALLFLGSSGTTYDELYRILGNIEEAGNEEQDSSFKELRLHRTLSHLLHILNNCSPPGVLLQTANEVFTDSSFNVLQTFQNDVTQLYGASARSFDFKSGGMEFQDHVNKWVQQKTKGKIRSIVDSPPSPLTTLALVNAVYFQGSWEVPFAPQITRDSVFHIDRNLTAPVKLMTNVMNISYIETQDYRMVRLPYRDQDTAMYIILPKKIGVDSLLEVERSLSSADLETKLEAMAASVPQMVTVKIPKMRMDSDGNLKDILLRLGINSVFEPHSANFSKISPTPGLHVSSLLHKATIDINEKGTEAAAVSIATGDRYIDSIPIPFVVNRPFLFFIHNNFVNSILFWGRVIQPQLPVD